MQPHPLTPYLKKGLSRGSHTRDQVAAGEFCALEAVNHCRSQGRDTSDSPAAAQLPDFRPLNDAFSTPAAAAEHLGPVLIAYWDWQTWTFGRRLAVIERVVIRTVNVLIAELPGLPADAAAACRSAKTLGEAEAAASAASAAFAASYAASDAASAASRSASRDRVLAGACKIWLEAAAGEGGGE